MKKLIALALSFILVFISTSCQKPMSSEELMESLPKLSLQYNIEKWDVQSGAVKWTDGNHSVVTDCAHPLDPNYPKPILVYEEQLTLNLQFSREPDSVTVISYSQEQAAAYQAGETTQEGIPRVLDDFQFEPEDKDVIYEVVGTWKQGTISYVFAVAQSNP